MQTVQDLIERLFGKKKEHTTTDGRPPGADLAPDSDPTEQVEGGPEAERPIDSQGPGVLDHTIVTSDDDLSAQILEATGNVFEDT